VASHRRAHCAEAKKRDVAHNATIGQASDLCEPRALVYTIGVYESHDAADPYPRLPAQP
jgi:hypothetical protein